MPVPTTTISASVGRSSVVRCPFRNSLGSLCQNEFVEVGVGREAHGCFMVVEVELLPITYERSDYDACARGRVEYGQDYAVACVGL